MQYDQTARVKNTLVHVIGQISYKQDCLRIVVATLNNWQNKELTGKDIKEIIAVYRRYKSFSALTPEQAIRYINKNYKDKIN